MRIARSALVLVLVGTVLAACSKGGTSGGGGTGCGAGHLNFNKQFPPTQTFGATKDATVAAEVPASIRSKGSITVAIDAEYAPNEAIQGGKIVGWDVALGQAIAAVMGLKFDGTNVIFDNIIPGIQSGKYDLGLSSFTDTKEREKVVDFVTYFKAGSSFVVCAHGGTHVTSLEQLCGKTAAVQTSTTQQADATSQSKKCTAAGKPAVKVLPFEKQTDANLALASGRAQVMMADTPIAAYQVSLSGGTLASHSFKLAGAYGVAPYGIAVPKNSGLLKPVQDAVNKLISDGIYMKILTEWGEQSGAVSSATTNGAIF